MVRSIVLQASFTAFVFLGAGLGDATLAANQVLMLFLEITAYALDGFAFAAEALIGQAVGARSPVVVRQAGRMCLQWGFGGAAWVYDGIFIGALLTGDMLRAMLVSVAVYGVALVLNGVRTITLWQRYPKVAARAAA